MLFAFVPIDGYGHVNSLLGLADALKIRGHDTVFICNDNTSTKSRHRTVVLRQTNTGHLAPPEAPDQKAEQEREENGDDVSQLDKKWMSAVDALDLESEPAEQLARNFAVLDYTINKEIFEMEAELRQLLAKLGPDVVVVDQLCTVPCIMASDSPYKWVRSHSCNPLSLYFERYPKLFPAPLLGVPVGTCTLEQRQQSWSEFQRAIACCGPTMAKLSQQAKLDGCQLINESPYLNLYMYPAYLDYTDHLFEASQGSAHQLDNWHRCDSLIRSSTSTKDKSSQWQVPECLQTKPGKLIYVSLGTTTSCNVALMKRLIGILAKCQHRSIVALGARHRQLFPLPSNMWGQKYVDQQAVLPMVDLVITHGGNNTITEALYYGVPGMIVCPMFHDQLDNAARIEEKGLGIRMNLFRCTEQQLLDAIDKVLGSADCKQRCRIVTEDMQRNERDAQWAASLLEQVGQGKRILGSNCSS